MRSAYLTSNQTLDEILQRKIKYIGYDLGLDYDYFTKLKEINSEDILKVTKKYLTKPFLSIYGDEKLCNKVKKLWIENF